MRTYISAAAAALLSLLGILATGLLAAGPAGAAVTCSVINTTKGTSGSNFAAALAAAGAGNTIEVHGTCVGHFTVTVPLTLIGGLEATLAGTGPGSVLTIDVPSGTVNIEYLEITGGSAAVGGGIAADATGGDGLTLDLDYDRVEGNTATEAGAGVYGGHLAALDVNTSLFNDNTIAGGSGTVRGAAIATNGPVDLYNSNVIGNQATAAPGSDVVGGALDLPGAATLDIVKLEDTTASGAAIDGGALAAGSSLSVTESDVGGNGATASTGPVDGGAIEATGPTAALDDTSVNGTSVTSGAGAIDGAGIEAPASTRVTFQEVSIEGNQATSGSGPISGVGIDGGQDAFTDSGILDNAGTSTSGAVRGGGILPGASLAITGGPITGNTVTSADGQADGGGIWTDVPTTIGDATVSGDTATTAGGGVYLTGATLTIGGSALVDDTAPTGDAIDNVGGTVSQTGSLIVGCTGCS